MKATAARHSRVKQLRASKAQSPINTYLAAQPRSVLTHIRERFRVLHLPPSHRSATDCRHVG